MSLQKLRTSGDELKRPVSTHQLLDRAATKSKKIALRFSSIEQEIVTAAAWDFDCCGCDKRC
jgi:hypothetical protein